MISHAELMNRMLHDAVSPSFKAQMDHIRSCMDCGSATTFIQPDGVAQWYKVDNNYICKRCYWRKWWNLKGKYKRHPIKQYMLTEKLEEPNVRKMK